MAKIWFVADGVPINGKPIEKSIEWCKDNLGLVPWHWKEKIDSLFVVNDKAALSDIADPRHVVITIEEAEAGWRAGFYYTPTIRIDEVKRLVFSN